LNENPLLTDDKPRPRFSGNHQAKAEPNQPYYGAKGAIKMLRWGTLGGYQHYSQQTDDNRKRPCGSLGPIVESQKLSLWKDLLV
jgi:hypothetical protein